MALEQIFNFGTINWSNIYYYVMVFIYTMVAAGVIAYMVYWLRFKYRVIVHDKRGDRNTIITVDRGRIFTAKDGTNKLKLWLFKKTIDAPPHNCIYTNSVGMLRKGCIHVYFYGTDSYTFLNLEGIETKKLIPIDANIADNARRARELREKYQNPSMLEKYGAIAMTMIVFLILVGSMIYCVSTNKAIAQSNAAASTTIAKAVERMATGNAEGNAEPEVKEGEQQVKGVTNGFGLF